ncbi:hypothetical protein HX833_03035 [Marine Group I thaumarchaeote]|uniref:Copper-binding protein n=1 Tax=Marine Group I thaumarchaeote TaxID=2511932 RepID=A0A7K4NPY1_9ARCH|nr:hypothetical protein [Marine Group I thaumarchaeote]
MKLLGKFFLAVFAFSLLSYGISGAAYAAVEPLSVHTDKEFYVSGSTITISGFIKDYDGTNALVLQIWSPSAMVYINQPTPSADGSYSISVTAGKTFNVDGDYIVKGFYGPQKNDAEFKFDASSVTATDQAAADQAAADQAAADQAAADAAAAAAADMDKEPEDPAMTQPVCGPGTVLKNNVCVAEQQKGGGCLIATAAFGSEMAPQVQFLREIRDNTVLQTQSGSTFMTGFNQFYYSFSPTIADYERENPAFKETVKIAITPMLTSLAILNYVDIDSEEEMLGYGIGIILLNIGMYFVAPAAIIFKIRNRK